MLLCLLTLLYLTNKKKNSKTTYSNRFGNYISFSKNHNERKKSSVIDNQMAMHSTKNVFSNVLQCAVVWNVYYQTDNNFERKYFKQFLE